MNKTTLSLILMAIISHSVRSMQIKNQCVTNVDNYKISWIDKSERDSNGIIHGELIGLKSLKSPKSFIHILPHIAISEDAYSKICIKDKFIATLYPESFIYGYRSWKLMKIDSEAYVCHGKLKDCIDSTRMFDSIANKHWEQTRKTDVIKLKLLQCLEQPCSEAFFESLNITKHQSDSILKQEPSHVQK